MIRGRTRQAGAARRATRAQATSDGPAHPVKANYASAPTISRRHHDYFCFEYESRGRTVIHIAGGPDRRAARGR